MRFAPILAPLALVGCALFRRTCPADAVAGRYSCCFESNTLWICGTRGLFYVRHDAGFVDLYTGYQRLRRSDDDGESTAFVVLQGAPAAMSTSGLPPEFVVRRVLEVRRYHQGDCDRWR